MFSATEKQEEKISRRKHQKKIKETRQNSLVSSLMICTTGRTKHESVIKNSSFSNRSEIRIPNWKIKSFSIWAFKTVYNPKWIQFFRLNVWFNSFVETERILLFHHIFFFHSQRTLLIFSTSSTNAIHTFQIRIWPTIEVLHVKWQQQNKII